MFEAREYAQELWGDGDLGDARRTRRAVSALAIVAGHPQGSFVDACRGDSALQERLYRFIRDDKGSDRDVLLTTGCSSLARLAQRECEGDIAIVQDTTSGGYRHAVREELGDLGGKAGTDRRGFFAHISLAVDAVRGTVVGPVDVQLAIRPVRGSPHKRDNKKIPYEYKESVKWESAAAAVDQRCAGFRQRLVFISDRESDVYEYLMSMVGSELRFVVRSSWDRRLKGREGRLRAKLAQQAPLCRVRVHLDQKGGRPARDAILEVRATRVCFDGRVHSTETLPALEINAVHLVEVSTPSGCEPIDWLLLSTEPIGSVDEVLKVVHLYCLRWLIEEYNKCCKSDGTDIEALRMQSRDALLRAVVLCMFAAAPLMRLRGDLLGKDARSRWPVLLDEPISPYKASSPRHCTGVLPDLYWVTLWRAIERDSPVPPQPPTCDWALRALAKLGGWNDSKRTGRPGYPALWQGWDRLLERVDALKLALSSNAPTLGLEATK
jgi:hypothetical protein